MNTVWRHVCAAAVGLALATTSCGGGSGSGGGGDGSTGPGCATCGAYGDILEAFCGVLDRCEDAVYPIAYRNRAECVSILAWATTCRIEDDEVNDVHHYRLEQKIPVVDGPRARACIDWLKTARCDEVARMNSDDGEGQGADAGRAANPCEGAFRVPDEDDDDDSSSGRPPAAAAGETCRSGDQSSCQAGLYCTPPVFSSATNDEVCPVCTPLPTAGQPCGSGYHCAKGLYCKAKDPRMPDQGGTCVPPEADGGECLSAEHCASGFCKRPAGGLGTCDPGGKAGSPCAGRADCRYPLLCNAQTVMCEELRPQGAPCTADEQCNYRKCDTAAGVCGLADGATCRSSSDCRSGYCNDSTRVCGVRKPVGAACTSSGECVTNECRNRICFDRCGSDRPCPTGQFCDDRTQQCRSPGADGAGCDDDEECQSGWCSPDDRCAKKPQIGDKCTRSTACYPLGYCSGGVCVKRKGPGASCDALDSCREPFLCRRGRCELINLSCKPAPKGEMCAYLRICQDNAYCDLADAVTCKARKPAGAACGQTGECEAALFCKSDAMTGTRLCSPRLGAGSTCQGDECAPGLNCVGTRTARTCQPGPAGQACDSRKPCPAGFHCSDNACQPPLPLGGDCLRASDVPCAAGLFCDFSKGCQPKKQLGEACSSRLPCVESLRCTGTTATCQPRAAAGEDCTSSSSDNDSGCEAGLFCDYVAAIKKTVCQAKRELGEICNGNDRCKSGACGLSGRCVTTNLCKATTP